MIDNLLNNAMIVALHVAAQHGRTSILSFLLHQQAPVNVVDYYGQTPLHLACQKGHQTATVSLFKCKTDIC